MFFLVLRVVFDKLVLRLALCPKKNLVLSGWNNCRMCANILNILMLIKLSLALSHYPHNVLNGIVVYISRPGSIQVSRCSLMPAQIIRQTDEVQEPKQERLVLDCSIPAAQLTNLEEALVQCARDVYSTLILYNKKCQL